MVGLRQLRRPRGLWVFANPRRRRWVSIRRWRPPQYLDHMVNECLAAGSCHGEDSTNCIYRADDDVVRVRNGPILLRPIGRDILEFDVAIVFMSFDTVSLVRLAASTNVFVTNVRAIRGHPFA